MLSQRNLTQKIQSYYKNLTYLKFRHNFVSLQIEMKDLMTKVAALLLLVWYCMSIIGFGVHTCDGSGKSFVVSFVEGFSCEDIHPEHHCTKDSCCQHSHNCCNEEDIMCLKSKSCCSSDYQVLSLTGTLSDEKSGLDYLNSSVYYHCIHSGVSVMDIHCPHHICHTLSPDRSPGRILDIQSVLRVWRI